MLQTDRDNEARRSVPPTDQRDWRPKVQEAVNERNSALAVRTDGLTTFRRALSSGRSAG